MTMRWSGKLLPLVILIVSLFHIYLTNPPGSLGVYSAQLRDALSMDADGATTTSAKGNGRQRPREDQHGTWIGNTWIPPRGWRYYSASEMKSVFRDRSVSMLWLGDSTCRRAFGTLYGILSSVDAGGDVSVDEINHRRIIDINKGNMFKEPCLKWPNHTFHPQLCRTMPNATDNWQEALHVGTACLGGVKDFVEMELANQTITKNINLMVVVLGAWEAMRARDCRKAGDPDAPTRQEEVIRLLAQLQSKYQITIVWRTFGYVDDASKKGFIDMMNQRAMDLIDELSLPNLTFVDWGQAVLPRSLPSDRRIVGDLKAHFGLEPRLVLAQMITNHLVDLY